MNVKLFPVDKVQLLKTFWRYSLERHLAFFFFFFLWLLKISHYITISDNLIDPAVRAIEIFKISSKKTSLKKTNFHLLNVLNLE